MFIYTENDIESYRNIQNTCIYTKTHPKHNNTFQSFQNQFSFLKNQVQTNQRSMLLFIALFILLRATQPN